MANIRAATSIPSTRPLKNEEYLAQHFDKFHADEHLKNKNIPCIEHIRNSFYLRFSS